jgi:PBP1b-binding outer membrane lipoprotein LpoB
MQHILITFLAILLVGCKNLEKPEQPPVKTSTHLVAPQNAEKTNVNKVEQFICATPTANMEPAPSSSGASVELSKLENNSKFAQPTVEDRPAPEQQPAKTNIPADSTKIMLGILVLCVIGVITAGIKGYYAKKQETPTK